MVLIRILYSQVLFLLTGSFLEALIFPMDNTSGNFWQRLSRVYLLGWGGLSVLLFLLGFFRVILNAQVIFLLPLFFCLGTLFLKRKKLKQIAKLAELFRRANIWSRNLIKQWSFLEKILFLAILLVILLQFQYLIRLPLLGFDSRAHWAFKTKILHYEGTFYSESFYESERIHPQVRHPLLLPISQIVITKSLGRYDDRLMRLPFVLIFASILCLFYNELKRYYKRLFALGFTLLMATIPKLNTPGDGGLTSGYADALVALFFLCMLIYFVQWLQKGEMKYIITSALFSIFTILIKDDGIGCLGSISLSFLVCLFLFRFRNWKRKIGAFLIFLFLITVFIIPARIYSYSLSVGKGEYFEPLLNIPTIRNNLNRLGMIFLSYKSEFLMNIPHWGILWYFLIFSMIYNSKRWFVQEVLFVGLAFFFYLGVLTVIFIVLPWNLSQFFAGSLARLVMHLAPACSYLISLLWVNRLKNPISS